MASVAFREMGEWFVDEARELFGDFTTLLMCGFFAFIGEGVIKILGMIAQGPGGLRSVVFTLLTFIVGQSFVACCLLSASKARLHERQPQMGDLFPTPPVLLNATLGQIFSRILTFLPLFILGMPFVVYVFASLGKPSGAGPLPILVVPLFLVSLFFVLLIMPFFYFVAPLIVDRRINVFDALGQSFTNGARDYFGLLVFCLLWTMLFAAGMMLSLFLRFLFFGLPVVWFILGPAIYGIQMRAYRSYFGLGPDWVNDAILRNSGFFEMVHDLEDERREVEERAHAYMHQAPPPDPITPASIQERETPGVDSPAGRPSYPSTPSPVSPPGRRPVQNTAGPNPPRQSAPPPPPRAIIPPAPVRSAPPPAQPDRKKQDLESLADAPTDWEGNEQEEDLGDLPPPPPPPPAP